jgi:hypothetical protein
MEKIKIYTITHKKFTCPRDTIYHPLHVGHALAKDLGYPGDDVGENISEKNCYYSELTGLYWIWKNEKDAEYLGLCHYRRYFVNQDGFTMNETEYMDILSKHDVIVSCPRMVEGSYYEEYKSAHSIENLEKTGEVLRELFPDYAEDFAQVVHGKKLYIGNLFAAPRKLFCAYAEWLFAIFFELEKRIDVESYDEYHKRVFGFLAEELLMVWVRHNKLDYYECRFGCTQEKAETLELKHKLRELVAQQKFTEAREWFYGTLEKRPDVVLEVSDISQELEPMIQIIHTCEQEQALGLPCMAELSLDLNVLLTHHKVLKQIIWNISCGAESEKEISYLIDSHASWAAIMMVLLNQPEYGGQLVPLLNRLAEVFYGHGAYGNAGAFLEQALQREPDNPKTLENVRKMAGEG